MTTPADHPGGDHIPAQPEVEHLYSAGVFAAKKNPKVPNAASMLLACKRNVLAGLSFTKFKSPFIWFNRAKSGGAR